VTTDPERVAEEIGAREIYRAVVEAAGAAIFVVDVAGRLVAANAAGRDLFGIDEDEHRPLRELLLRGHIRTIDGVPVEAGRGPTSRAIRGETIRGEYAFFHARTGADLTFRVIAAPFRGPDSAIRGAILTMHDVSSILRTEREKEEFLSLVTHELKTPLTPLKTVAQLIRSRVKRARDGARPLDMDALEKNVTTIERQVDRMDRLVTDLLEVSRIGRGRFELRPTPFDLAHVVRDVVQRWIETTAEEGRHTFELQAPATLPVTADQGRVEHVVMDLVGNAVKYSPRGGPVRVRLDRKDGNAVVSVSDDGIGIPPDEVDKLGKLPFERGKRAHGYAGVGIGLYLSRLIAEGHGGRIDLASDGEDKGTTVELVLPIAG
jgi:PAS domain S-box-containing protein